MSKRSQVKRENFYPIFRMVLISFGLFSFLSQEARAIVNIEDRRLSEQKDGIGVTAGAGLSAIDGNSEVLSLNANGKIDWKKGIHSFFILGDESYSESKTGGTDLTLVDKTMAHARYTHELTSKTAWETFVQWQRNDLLKLKRRIFAGGGLRTTWVKKENEFFSAAGLGVFYFDENHRMPTDGADVDDDGVCINLYGALTWSVNQYVKLHDTLYYQPRVDDLGDYRFLNEFTMSLTMGPGLNFNVGVNVTHDSDYPGALFIDSADVEYKTSVTYQFL